MQKKSLKLTIKALGLLLVPAAFLFFANNYSEAAVGLSVGNSGLNLLQTENLFYGNLGSGSHASSSFLLFQNNNVDKLRIDVSGNLTTSGAITAGAFSGPITGGSISAANVSAGSFGSNVGNGNFSFPGNVGIGTTSPSSKLDVAGQVSGSDPVSSRNFVTMGWLNSSWGGRTYEYNFGGYYNANTPEYIGTILTYSNGSSGTFSFEFSTQGEARMTTGVVNVSNLGGLATPYVRITSPGRNNAQILAKRRADPAIIDFYYTIPETIGYTPRFKVYNTSSYTSSAPTTPASWDFTFDLNTLYTRNIITDGSVGIGITNPGAKLDVNGTFKVSGALNSVVLEKLSGTGSRIVMTDASGSLYATSSTVATGLPNASGISGQTLRSDGSNWVANSVLYNNGTNVAVGTTNPGTEKLTVVGGRLSTTGAYDIYSGGQIFSAGTGANAFAGRLAVGQIGAASPRFYVNGGAAIGTSYSTANMATGTLAVEGNIGVGTTNPVARVYVSDPTTSTGNIFGSYSSALTTGAMINLAQASSTFSGTGLFMNFQVGSGTSTANFLDFFINSSRRFAVNYRGGLTSSYSNDNDNVNLNNITLTNGNTNAAGYYALYANGQARTLTSQSGTGADELFDNNYEGFKFNSGTYANIAGFYISMKRGVNTPANSGAAIRAYLYADNGGQPGAYITNSGAVYLNRINTTYSNVYFPFNATLTANTDYWMLIYKWTGISAADQIYFNSSDSGGSSMWAYGNGTSWSLNAAKRPYFGIYTRSTNGIFGNSLSATGVYGNSTFGYGVRGSSTDSSGVFGSSFHGYGGHFDSGAGLYNNVNNAVADAISNTTYSQRTGTRYLDVMYNTAFSGTGLYLNLGSNVYTVYYYYNNGTAFTDYTSTARQAGGSAYPVISDSDDAFYIGRSSGTTSYRQFFFDFANTPNLSGVVWEYGSGADGAGDCNWTAFDPSLDETAGLTRDGMVSLAGPTLASCKVNNQAGYWFRVRATSVVTGANAYYSAYGTLSGYFARFYGADIERLRNDYAGRLYTSGPVYPGTIDEEDSVQTARYIYDAGVSGLAVNTGFTINGAATVTQPMIVGAPILAGHAATKNYVDSQISSSTNAIAFWSGSLSGNISNANTGNVGVGTTNPKSLFYLYGTNPRLSLSHNVLNAGDVGIDFLLNNNGTGEKKSAIIVTPVGSYSRGNMSFVLDSAADSNNYDYTTDTKLFIKNDGNVGIGTTNPQSNLDVSSNSPIIRLTDTDGGYHTFGGNAGVLDFSVDAGNTIANSRFVFSVDGGEKLRLDSSGNVGIGIANPNSRLHLYNSAANAEMDLQSVVGAGNHWALYNNLSDNSFRIWGNNDYLSILRNGNIGIGTTNPGNRFSTYYDSAVYNPASYNTASMALLTPNTDNDFSGIRFANSTYNREAFFGVVQTAANTGDFVFQGYNGSTYGEYMRIKASGNVGIGTTAPTAKLEIRNSSQATYPSIKFDVNQYAGVIQTEYNGGSYAYLNLAPASGEIRAYRSGVNAFLSGYNSGGTRTFLLDTSGNSYFNAGNVGIGTTDPSAKLDVSGSIRATSATLSLLSGTGGRIVMTDASGSLYATSSSIATGLPNASGISGQTLRSDGSNWVANSVLYNNGTNVGIGTTNPTSKLDIRGLSNAYSLRILSSDGSSFNAGIYSNSDNSAQLLLSAGASGIGVAVRGNGVSYFNGGNVGIGTTNPTYKLTTVGTGWFHASSSGVRQANINIGEFTDNPASPAYTLYTDDTTNSMEWRANRWNGRWNFTRADAATDVKAALLAANYLDDAYLDIFKVGGSVGIHLDSGGTSYFNGGNVGIGTTTPTAKLYVNGTSIFNDLATFTQPVIVGTPVLSSHAATKSYVDSAMSSTTAAVSVSSISLTGSTYNGSLAYTGGFVGYDAGNKICNAFNAGSHFCRTDEIIYLIQKNGASSFSAISGADAWIADGPPGFTGAVSADDCGGWTDSTNNKLGHFWIFNASGGGRGSLSSCDTLKKITCCK